MTHNLKNGFSIIKTLLIGIIIIVFISLLGYNIEEDVVENPTVQTNFSFVLTKASNLWDNHLATPALYVWNDIIIDMLWDPFVEDVISGDFINQINNPASEL